MLDVKMYSNSSNSRICASTSIKKQHSALQETGYLVHETFFYQTAPKSDLVKGGL